MMIFKQLKNANMKSQILNYSVQHEIIIRKETGDKVETHFLKCFVLGVGIVTYIYHVYDDGCYDWADTLQNGESMDTHDEKMENKIVEFSTVCENVLKALGYKSA